ncbi:MAG: class I SAM-dependent RNA methyltransferase [Lachnospiraceae bacterium]|jgi:tRNA/tmRNA/rRNA uracil-C5-methylase (TrmA/RlmC/RlmD family)|nr:class I SAM-dependent RNA methyltransferase [Lachnospiraceae bacterium]
MKKGQIIEGRVIRLDYPNKGVVETAEGTCVVKNTLPGQQITLMINKIKKGKPEGRLLSVEESSVQEIASPCPHFGRCGGCTLQSLPYSEQLQIKGEQVRRLLEPIMAEHGSEGCWEGIKGSPRVLGYRNKMEFTFGDEEKDGPLTVGLHRRNSFYDVVPVADCAIVDEDYRRILRFCGEFFTDGSKEKPFSFYHRIKHEGWLRHLLVRKAVRTGEILVALVTTSQEKPQWSEQLVAWSEGIQQLPLDGKMTGILHIINDSVSDVVRSDRTEILYGQDWFYEEILGMRFKISVFSFFQTNSLGAEVLYETAREFIGGMAGKGADADKSRSEDIGKKMDERNNMDKPVVFDLYSGTGTIAQMMAPAARKVIGVEIVAEAVEAARENAVLNGLDNCEFLAGDVLKVLDEIEERPDFIILDPPRDGLHPKVVTKVVEYGVERVLYISCKPSSLVRDLEGFVKAGYGIERGVAVDMFPGTGHVETIVLLQRRDT